MTTLRAPLRPTPPPSPPPHHIAPSTHRRTTHADSRPLLHTATARSHSCAHHTPARAAQLGDKILELEAELDTCPSKANAARIKSSNAAAAVHMQQQQQQHISLDSARGHAALPAALLPAQRTPSCMCPASHPFFTLCSCHLFYLRCSQMRRRSPRPPAAAAAAAALPSAKPSSAPTLSRHSVTPRPLISNSFRSRTTKIAMSFSPA